MDSDARNSAALYEWIGSFGLRRGVRSVEDLNDGTLIWEVLQDIDPNYFTGLLPEKNPGDQWVPRWQNLKYIHKFVLSFLNERADPPLPNVGGTVDLQAIAQDESTKDLNLLLKLLVIASLSSPNTGEYVMRMQQMATSTQETLMYIISQAKETSLIEPEVASGADAVSTSVPRDLELAFEERVGKVIAENDRLVHEKGDLQQLLDSMHDRHAALQQKHDTAQRELEDSQDRLLTLRSGKGADSAAGRDEARSQQQENLIASLESKAASAQDETENLRRQNETLKLKAENSQKLQDDYDEIKIERDQLLRRANAAEKYKQKLQQMQDFEKHNSILQAQVEELKKQLKNSDTKHFTTAELERENDEYKKMLPRIEQDRHDLSEMKKQLEYDNHVLMVKLEQATQQHARDAATIDALRDGVNGSDGPGTPMTPRAPASSSGYIPNFDDETEKDTEAEETDATLIDPTDAEGMKILHDGSVSEQELNALLNAMRNQAAQTGQANEKSNLEMQKEFAETIANASRNTKRVIEVINLLSEPRDVEFISATNLDLPRSLSIVTTPVNTSTDSLPYLSASALKSSASLYQQALGNASCSRNASISSSSSPLGNPLQTAKRTNFFGSLLPGKKSSSSSQLSRT